jgi:hypothetical protein
MMPKRILTVVALLAATLLSDHPAYSQGTNGSIQGTVTDSSGAVIAGAVVQVKNTSTGVTRSVPSNDQGRYNATDLIVGEYEAQVTMQGFQTNVQKAIPVTVGSQRVVDFTLQVGRSEQTVTVEATVSQVDTTSSAVAALVEQKQIAELPLNGRNYTQLIALAPGVQQTTQAGAGNGFYGRQASFSVAGSRPEGQAFLLDGVDVQGFWQRGIGSSVLGTTLGVEALAEFSTQTNTYSAQFGGNGAAINAVTKSGTNQIHGTVFEFLRNSAMDARNLFDGAKLPPFKQNQFGGSVGGPLVKDKAFFFVNYEGLRRRQAFTRIANVPDANARQGILPGLTDIVPIHPTTRTLLTYFPLPTTLNLTAAGLPTGTGRIPIVATQQGGENYVLARVDYNLTAKDALFGRYVRDYANFTDPFSGSNIPLWPETHRTRNQYFTLEERHVVSPTVVNLARASVVRTGEGSDLNQNLPGLFFYPNRKNGTLNLAPAGLSNIGSSIFLPFKIVQNKFIFSDDVYWTRGSHNIKIGGGLQRTQSNVDAPGWLGGQYTFLSLESFLRGNAATFLGSLPGQENGYRDFRDFNITGYITDDWKATQRLTINLGARYHFITNPTTNKQPLTAILDFARSTEFTKVPNVFLNNPSSRNFDPRIGFAYDLLGNHKTSLRGGFGVYHNPIVSRTYASGYYFNAPYLLATANSPSFPDPFAAGVGGIRPTQSQANGINYDTPNTPYQLQWNVNLQHEVMNGTILMVGYVGSQGKNLFRQRDQNPVVPQTINGRQVFGQVNATGSAIVPFARVNTNFTQVNSAETKASSNYHSLQSSLNRRFKNNLQYGVSYTWSHCIDNGSGTSGLEGAQPVMNTYNPDLDRGNCVFDRRHTFVTNSLWALPFKGSFKGHQVVEGWQLSGIATVRSGAPYNPGVGFDITGALGQYAGASRPNVKAGATADSLTLGTLARYFDTNGLEAPALGTFGNLGRNVLRGPGFWNVDMSAIKDTRITENKSLQFRAEFFNIFNHPSWGAPNPASFSLSRGTAVPNVLAGQITTTTSTARQVQLALKLIF